MVQKNMSLLKKSCHQSLDYLLDIGLIIIAVATVIAIGVEIKSMIEARSVTLADLLLLFIYLEVLTMVSIYLDSGKLPVIVPLYIAIVALARYVTIDMKSLETYKLLAIAAGILLLALTVLLLKYGHSRFAQRNDIT